MTLDDSQGAKPPKTVTVSDPIVTGVDPAPDDKDVQESSKEAYSEAGLSGEAAADAHLDTEPFMLRQRPDEEIADYNKGFECGKTSGQNDETKSEAWQRGWTGAQE
jgi:hypothetical protein